jgi:hypothetical protein
MSSAAFEIRPSSPIAMIVHLRLGGSPSGPRYFAVGPALQSPLQTRRWCRCSFWTEAAGFGYFLPDRLKETYKVVAQSQELDPNQPRGASGQS